MSTCPKTKVNIEHTNFNFMVSIMQEISRKQLGLKLVDSRNNIRLRPANGIDVPYVSMVRIDIDM